MSKKRVKYSRYFISNRSLGTMGIKNFNPMKNNISLALICAISFLSHAYCYSQSSPSDIMMRADKIEKDGDTYFEQRDYNGAITSYRSAIYNWQLLSESNPNIGFVRPELYLKISNSYILSLNYDLAIQNCNEYISMVPKSGEGYYIRGVARFDAKDNAGACKDWVRAELLGAPKAQSKISQYCK